MLFSCSSTPSAVAPKTSQSAQKNEEEKPKKKVDFDEYAQAV